MNFSPRPFLATSLIAMLMSMGLPQPLPAADWIDVSSSLLARLTNGGAKTDWPGGCSGVVVNRTNGAVTIKVVGLGLWRSLDSGGNWRRVDDQTVSGRDETGWAPCFGARPGSRGTAGGI